MEIQKIQEKAQMSCFKKHLSTIQSTIKQVENKSLIMPSIRMMIIDAIFYFF